MLQSFQALLSCLCRRTFLSNLSLFDLDAYMGPNPGYLLSTLLQAEKIILHLQLWCDYFYIQNVCMLAFHTKRSSHLNTLLTQANNCPTAGRTQPSSDHFIVMDMQLVLQFPSASVEWSYAPRNI